MKNFLTILLGIICVTVLIFGRSYWNQQIEEASAKNKNSLAEKPSSASTSTTQNDNLDLPSKDLIAFTGNWPASAVDQFKHTLSENKPFKILFVGSPAIGSDTSGTYPVVKEKLIATFGKKNIDVSIHTFNTTSSQFIKNKGEESIADEGADLIIFEPFILLNNGFVVMENTLKDITQVIEEIKAVQPAATFILQPSYPLYKAKIYPSQVTGLKKFAEKNKITYLDHWSAWPDPNADTMKEYLQPDQSAPSEKGNKAWSDFLINYLISE